MELVKEHLARLVEQDKYFVHIITTGAGCAAEKLWQVPGASKVLLGGQTPYSTFMTDRLLGYAPNGYANTETAAAMANIGYYRAMEVACMAGFKERPILSVACSAAVQTARARRGEDRAHLAIRTAQGLFVQEFFLSREQNREQQGTICDLLTLNLMLWGADLPLVEMQMKKTTPAKLTVETFEEPYAYFDRSGTRQELRPDDCLLFPGSFNGLHFGHIKAARYGEQASGKQVVFELVEKRVGKEAVSREELLCVPIRCVVSGHAWLQRMHGSSSISSRTAFGTSWSGTDTAERVMNPALYEGTLNRVLGEMADAGVRFYVMQRSSNGAAPKLVRDYIPSDWARLFVDLPGRFDISSSELRAAALSK